MDAAELIRRYPRLFHMAQAGSWESAQQHGLLSTSALLDKWSVPEGDRSKVESEIRPESVKIEHEKYGTAVIRDNKPLRAQFLLLEGMNEAEWCRLLNSYVFFWPTEERLLSLLCARAYRDDEHDVITIATEDLVDRYEDRIRLSRLNSGSTLYPNAPQRGRETFRRIEDFNDKDVVEIAVEHSVPAIAEIALLVERRRQDQIQKTLYRR